MSDATLTDDGTGGTAPPAASQSVVGLALCWSAHEPERVGQVLLVPPGKTRVFGRGDAQADDPGPRVHLAADAPGERRYPGPLAAPKVSRQQVLLTAAGANGLRAQNIGRCQLFWNGKEATHAELGIGDTLQIGAQLLFVCIARPLSSDPAPAGYGGHRFGEADADGIVGESPRAWALRRAIAFAAPEEGHVLVCGPSGSGKELVARALHARSPFGGRELVSRSAATLPEGLVDAELFGNARNYPNPGMADRPGLVGAADGTSLFLDELGELSPALQGHLLRVLDRGEYQRLGESAVRRSTFRLLAATNAPERLKHDLVARFRFVIEVPELGARREDIPLLVRHRLGDKGPLGVKVLDAIVRHAYTTHVRELDALVWRALSGAPLVEAGARPVETASPAPPEAPALDPRRIDRDTLERALRVHDGVLEKVWRSLGLSSRYALHRLLVKHKLKG